MYMAIESMYFLAKKQEGIADEFLKKLGTWASSIKVCDPLEKECRLGPLVSASQVCDLNV